MAVSQVEIAATPTSARKLRVTVDELDAGLYSRSFDTLLPANALQRAQNCMFLQDGVVSKRFGNVNYGGGSGSTSSGAGSLSGFRFYTGNPKAGILFVQSGGKIWQGTDVGGTFAHNSGITPSSTTPGTWAQMFDPQSTPPSGGAQELFYCDGSQLPYRYDTSNGFRAVRTGSSGANSFLPNGVKSGTSITPFFVKTWGPHLVYANEPTDGGATWISDALRPECFNGFGLVTNDNTPYIPYYFGGQDADLGDITGIAIVNGLLIQTYNAGVVTVQNTGSWGAYEFYPQVISRRIGAFPYSIVEFDNYIVFWGGDRFYACDGNTVVPFADFIPAQTSPTALPITPTLSPATTVRGMRESSRYWASFYNSVSSLGVYVFDVAANGGWQYGSQPFIVDPNSQEAARGGAWSYWLGTDFPPGWGVECDGPGDTQQFFWGALNVDKVAQFAKPPASAVYSDFGDGILIDVLTKALTISESVLPKTPEFLWSTIVLPATNAGYSSAPTPYVVQDSVTQKSATLQTSPIAVLADDVLYTNAKAAIQSPTICNSVALGISESSANPFAIIGFSCELTEEPNPKPISGVAQ